MILPSSEMLRNHISDSTDCSVVMTTAETTSTAFVNENEYYSNFSVQISSNRYSSRLLLFSTNMASRKRVSQSAKQPEVKYREIYSWKKSRNRFSDKTLKRQSKTE